MERMAAPVEQVEPEVPITVSTLALDPPDVDDEPATVPSLILDLE